MLIEKEQDTRLNSIFNTTTDNKEKENQERILKNIENCGNEIKDVLQEYGCAIYVVPGLFIDDEMRLRINPQVGVRYVDSQ